MAHSVEHVHIYTLAYTQVLTYMYICMHTQDTVRCISCPPCEAGYHVDAASGNCSCSPCKASCPLHYRMSNACSSDAPSDTITCIPCTTCAPGEWVDQACFGTTTVDEGVCKVRLMCHDMTMHVTTA
jgi:hypothetical protein